MSPADHPGPSLGRQPFEPQRARQLRMLLLLVVAAGALLALLVVWFLLGGSDVGLVLVVVGLPAVLLVALGLRSRVLIGHEDPSARVWVPVTAVVTILVGMLFSRTVPGILLGVLGVLLILYSLLPGRDGTRGDPSGPASRR